jgi:hypothetical protein
MATQKLRWEALPPTSECSHPLGHQIEAIFEFGYEIPRMALCKWCDGIGEVIVLPRDSDDR